MTMRGRRAFDDALTDEGGEKREFVAFNLQLKTLRWGWQSALGVDQMTAIAIEGPGIARPGEAQAEHASQVLAQQLSHRSRSKRRHTPVSPSDGGNAAMSHQLSLRSGRSKG